MNAGPASGAAAPAAALAAVDVRPARTPLAATAAITGLFALCPAALTWLLVAGLRLHRPDLDLPRSVLVVLIIGLAGWIAMLAVAAVGDGRPAPDGGVGELGRLAVRLVGFVYLLVAFGVLVRLRFAGGPGGSGRPLTCLTAALAVGTVGLVALAHLVRTVPAGILISEELDDHRAARIQPVGAAVLVTTFAVFLLAVVAPRFHLSWGADIRPAALVAPLLVASFAMVEARDGPVERDDSLGAGDMRFLDRQLTVILSGLGLILALALDPARPTQVIAALAGLAVLVVALTPNWRVSVIGGAVTLGAYLLSREVRGGLLHSPYASGAHADARSAALALARGGTFGSGPGAGLVESYATPGATQNRYALSVLAEELGLVGLVLAGVAVAAVGLLCVRLAARAEDSVGAFARALAAVTVVTLALPVVPLVWPALNIDAALPGIAPDEVGLVVLLWTVGALVGAAGRAEVHRSSGPPPARARLDLPVWVRPLAAAVCALVVIGLVLQATLTAGVKRRSLDAQDALAVAAADGRRPRASLTWPRVIGVDAATRNALNDVADGGARCPARPSRDAPGTRLGPGCAAGATVYLNPKAQNAAAGAIGGLGQGATGSVVAIDARRGRVLVLATTSDTGWWTAEPTGDLVRPLLAAALNANPDTKQAVLTVLRREELGKDEQPQTASRQPFAPDLLRELRDNPEATDIKFAGLLIALNEKIKGDFRDGNTDCVAFDPDSPLSADGPRYTTTGSCAQKLVDAVLADPNRQQTGLKALLTVLKGQLGLTGAAGAELRDEKVLVNHPSDADDLGVAAAGTCAGAQCVQASPMQLAVAYGALVRGDGTAPVPHVLGGPPEPKSVPTTGLTGRVDLGSSAKEKEGPAAGKDRGAWAVRAASRGSDQVVVVGYVNPGRGGAATAKAGTVADEVVQALER
ncbi:FtsW/RodA/SpoVE family cell cycle protein [Frankia sp. AgB32]|uniref:FtsW/RodA/SpoVE family cell cycle protein n=1 Tax=Frankia sp. AgB32 TaxID=631119 RepID=UPI0020107095|nr:FtsW/RodA/SpoVE family cell cycle protein [Frankia sp. AgB32]MCK9896906.1 FtsW/RodA/SpoVE family cell cycle protein [Frankia sp. AgB32]